LLALLLDVAGEDFVFDGEQVRGQLYARACRDATAHA
jgi:hypothetical protein